MNGNNGIECESCSATAAYAEKEHELKPVRIWVVDDNDGLREVLVSVLNTEEGFECSRQFASPAGVLNALARETAPDVIILDIQMGADNGLDAIQPIKTLAPGTQVLMFTTLASREARERAFREGASDFMLKSWSVDEIAGHIRRANEFGSVAALLTPVLSRENVPAEANPAEIPQKTSLIDRWIVNLRGLLKFSPS